MWLLLWLRSVCWVIKLDTPRWDILVTGVAVYLKASLESLNYKHTKVYSLAKVREKPPAKVENRENGVWGRENSLHLPRLLHKREE